MKLAIAFSGAATVLLLGTAIAADVRGFEPWRLGMTREEVLAVKSAGPYLPVPTTGGLETPNAEFQGRKVTASFVFGDRGLRHIQIWAYEGSEFQDALRAFHEAYAFLSAGFGPLHSDGAQIPAGLSREELDQLVPPVFRTGTSQSALGELETKGSMQAQVHKFHLHPQQPATGADVYASLMHSPQVGSYWVFVYFKSPDAGH